MNNPFDQFDQSAGNPFDQFDQQANPFDQFDQQANPLGGSNNFQQQFQQAPVIGGLETAANMISALPGQAAGGIAAAGQGLLSLPEMVGLPGIGGASMGNVPKVYQQVEDYVNNQMFGKGLQVEPRTEVGKRYIENVGKAMEKGIELGGDVGDYFGGSAGRAVGQAGTHAVMELGLPAGAFHLGTKVKKGGTEGPNIRALEVESAARKALEARAKAAEEITTDVPLPEVPGIADLPPRTPDQSWMPQDQTLGPAGLPEVPSIEATRTPEPGLPEPNLLRGLPEQPQTPGLYPEGLPEVPGMAGRAEARPVPGETPLPDIPNPNSPLLPPDAAAIPKERQALPRLKAESKIPEGEQRPGWSEPMPDVRDLYAPTPEQIATAYEQGIYPLRLTEDIVSQSKKVQDTSANVYPIAHLADANGNVQVRTLLRDIHDSPIVSSRLRYLAKVLDKLPTRWTENLEILVSDKPQVQMPGGGMADAYYSGTNHRIVLGAKNANARTAMHELVHAVTLRAVDDPKNRHIKARLQDILDQVKAKGFVDNTRGFDFYKFNQGDIPTSVYGLENIKEMLAEAFTNREFQKILNGIEVKQGNVFVNGWKAFTSAISKLFGRDVPAMRNALDEVLGFGEMLMHDTSIDYGKSNKKTYTVSNIAAMKPDVPTKNVLFDTVEKATKYSDRESNSPLAAPQRERQVMSKIEGLRKVNEEFVARDPAPEQVIELARDLPDISDGWRWVGGAEMISSIKNNPVLFAVGQWYRNASNRANLYINQTLNPLEKQVNTLFKNNEAEVLHGVFRAEMDANKRLTSSELEGLGLSTRQLDAYSQLRNAFDEALDKQNNARLEQGKEPITPREAYVSSIWHGDWRIPIYDKNGKLVWYVAANSKGNALSDVKAIKQRFPDLVVNEKDLSYRSAGNTRGEKTLQSTYTDLIDLLGRDDPTVQTMQRYMEGIIEAEGETALGQKKHFEPKAGVRGFMGDRPWLSDTRNAKDFFKAQMSYLRNAAQWSEMQTATGHMKKLLTDPDLQTKTNMMDWAKEKAKIEMGTAEWEPVRGMEKGLSGWVSNVLADVPGVKHMPTDVKSMANALSDMKSIFYIKTLGLFNVPFAVMNMIQPAFVMPHHLQLSNMGFKHNPVKTFGEGLFGGLGMYFNGMWGLDHTKMPKFWQDAQDFAIANQIHGLNQLSEVKRYGQGKTREMMQNLGGFTIKHPEAFARSVAFMSYASHLKQSGKFDSNMAIYQEALKLTDKSMANYRHTERAPIFEKMGMTGEALSSLKTFPINQYAQLYDFAKYFQRTGDPTPLMLMMGVQLSFAGALGFYGMETIEQLYDLFRAGYSELGGKNKSLLEFSPKSEIMKNTPDWLQRGAVSKLSGLSYGSRLDNGTIIDPSLDDNLPVIKEMRTFGVSLAKMLHDQDAESRDQFAYAASPSSLRNFMEMNLPTMSRDRPEAIKSPTRPERGPKGIRTPEDIRKKDRPFIGMPTQREADIKERDFRQMKTEGYIKTAQDFFSNKFDKSIRLQDPEAMQDAILTYSALGGDPRTLFRSIKPDMLRQFLTTEQLLATQARSPSSVQKYLRYKAIMDSVRGGTQMPSTVAPSTVDRPSPSPFQSTEPAPTLSPEGLIDPKAPKSPPVSTPRWEGRGPDETWKRLSSYNDPPDKVSDQAAHTAATGMSTKEVRHKLAELKEAYRKGSRTTTGDARDMLKREIQLFERAVELRN